MAAGVTLAAIELSRRTVNNGIATKLSLNLNNLARLTDMTDQDSSLEEPIYALTKFPFAAYDPYHKGKNPVDRYCSPAGDIERIFRSTHEIIAPLFAPVMGQLLSPETRHKWFCDLETLLNTSFVFIPENVVEFKISGWDALTFGANTFYCKNKPHAQLLVITLNLTTLIDYFFFLEPLA